MFQRALVPNRSVASAVIVALIALASGCGDDGEPELEPEWREAFDAENVGWLLSTWGTGQNDRYAVGGELASGVIMHFDGDAWRRQEVGSETPLLNWVHGFASDDVVVVGNAGTILRFDGAEWTKQQSPTSEDLWGVWGPHPDRLWAVGGSGRAGAEAVVLSYEGDEWSLVALPPIDRANVRAFFKVWGTSADNVIVVGQSGILLRYDGERWNDESIGVTGDLIAVWGTGPDDILAVGGRSNAIINHFDGDEWHTTTLFELPGVNGVWMQTPGVAHLAVTRGRLAVMDVQSLEFEAEVIDEALDFHGIFGIDGQLTAVGGNFEMLGLDSFQGIAWQRGLGNED